MNEMNELEMQLRSWAPRRPSEKLKQRLFNPQPEPTPAEGPAFRLSWLAPAAATLLLMGLLFNQHNNPAISDNGSSVPIMAMILSNQSAACYFPGSFQPEQNRLPADTFEWTNTGSSTSSIRSLFLQKGK